MSCVIELNEREILHVTFWNRCLFAACSTCSIHDKIVLLAKENTACFSLSC